MQKLPWKDTSEYQDILDILKCYWLSEPDEAFVSVEMEFIKKDGQRQSKLITRENPNLHLHHELVCHTAAEIANMDFGETVADAWLKKHEVELREYFKEGR